MYSESAGSRKTLGDVDVVYHDGIYHLFHLVLPNHDFIAHAVSSDCFSWRRVENSLFIGHPGSWDDSMLWTVHVTPDPHNPGWWRMFYTGLSRRDSGQKQRIGMARSRDLYVWEKAAVDWEDRRSPLPYALPDRPSQPPFEKDPESCFPMGPWPEFYESSVDEGRGWVSWRDPYYYRENGRGWLLCAGRVKEGPVVRRGAVAAMEETSPNHFEPRPALHHPGLYDDVEVPNLIKIDDEYYLIGSIREDAKVRYWHTQMIGKPWQSYHDNVILAAGNYAGRVCKDDRGFLLFSFFSADPTDRLRQNLMPPPKRLHRSDDGTLRAVSFEGYDDRIEGERRLDRACPLKPMDSDDRCIVGDGRLKISNHSGFQAFLFDGSVACFRFRARMKLCGRGKTGFVFRIDEETHDGYYLSLDLIKGVAQIRSWGSGPPGSGEEMMQFKTLQSGYWAADDDETALQLIAYGSYLELSVGDRVVLSLADQRFQRGGLGVYVESASIEVIDPRLETLRSPVQSDEHLTNG